MILTNLKPIAGSHKKSFKVGRGPGSGLGKTCGRGTKGAGARKSPGRSPGFEGGQMPLQRRIAKVGFRSHFPRNTQIVNLRSLEKLAVGTVTVIELVAAGIVEDLQKPIKILGTGKLTKAFKVKANKFSASAEAAIVAAGGSVEVI